MTKLDIMKNKDGDNGWTIKNGKVTKVKKIIVEPIKEKPIETPIEIKGPVIRESITEVKEVKKEEKVKKWKK